jgi:putative FmdB family regulatory protein
MPIYEYACPTCQVTFETFLLRRSDEADVSCPTCHGREVRRQLSCTAPPRGGGEGGSGGGAGPGCGPVG